MRTGYVAYGLQLLSSFPLAGMSPAADDRLPSLHLDVAGDSALDAIWSGTDGPPVWRGLLGDGRELAIERGLGGDLLFAYGDRARFRLDPHRRSLLCAPREDGLAWQRALLGKVITNVSVMRGYEALHASALLSPEGVVAILAPSGVGKTTLALELLRRGWSLFADDALALASGGKGIYAHPGTPHMSVSGGSEVVEGHDGRASALAVFGGESWIAVAEHARQARPVRAVVLLSRGPNCSLSLEELPPNPLELVPYMLGIPEDVERERHRFTLFADLASTTRLLRLTGGEEDTPRDLADLIEGALELGPLAIGEAA